MASLPQNLPAGLFDLVQEGCSPPCPTGNGGLPLHPPRLSGGDKAAMLLTNDTVATLHRWTSQLRHEAHLYTGFVRFTDWQGRWWQKLSPKARVLP